MSKPTRVRLLAVVLPAWFVVCGHAAPVIHLPLDGESQGLSLSGEYSFEPGVVGQAMALGGPNRGVWATGSDCEADLSGAISVGCWFKATGLLKGGFRILSSNGVRLAVGKDGSHPYTIADGLECVFAGIAKTRGASGHSNVCDGKWHHLMATYDGKTLALYIDGAMEDIVDASGSIKPGSRGVTLGQNSPASGNLPDDVVCYLDDVRIHDRAVDDETITTEYGRNPSVRMTPVDCRRVDLHEDFLERGVVPIQAHRGGSLTLPEHTIETYLDTWSRGMIPEADIRTTKDDVIICIHDNDARRVCPDAPQSLRNMTFDQMTLAQVKRLDVGRFRGKPGQTVPTLEEVFARMKGRPERKIELDYKQIALERLASLVRKYDLGEQVIFVTQHHHLIRQWQQVYPRSMTLLWMGGTEHALTKRLAQLHRDDFAGISIVQIIVFPDDGAEDGFRPSIAFLKQCEQRLDRRGIRLQLIPWNTSDRRIFERLVSAGFRFFGTDYPQTALEAYLKTQDTDVPTRTKPRLLE